MILKRWLFRRRDILFMVTTALINVIGSMLLEFADAQNRGPRDLYPIANEIDPLPPMSPDIPKQAQSDGEFALDMVCGVALNSASVSGPRDCAEILDNDKTAPSGVYKIFPPNCPMCYFNVYCDMHSEGGGWTVSTRIPSMNLPKPPNLELFRSSKGASTDPSISIEAGTFTKWVLAISTANTI